MIQLGNSEHIVIIEDAFVEDVLKTVKRWKESLDDEGIEDLIIREVVQQMEDGSDYINFYFKGNKAIARELGHCPDVVSVFISKEKVTLRNKMKSVRIKKGSAYEGLNDNPVFIRALTDKYNTDYNTFVFFLPVKYEAPLRSKDEEIQTSLFITVDIPFSDIEVCE